MIAIQLLGRLGNCMFLIGLGLSLQQLYSNKKVVFYFSPAFPEDTKIVCLKYIHIFKDYFKIKFVDNLPADIHVIDHENFEELADIPIHENTLLRSFFQSHKFLNNKLCIERLKCPDIIKQEIDCLYGDLSDLVSLHVRRGDYLGSGYFLTLDFSWYYKCMNFFPKDQKFIVISDEIEWCKTHFAEFNVMFADKQTSNSEMVDMYIQSLCKHNIISASSFSWWGSYLNSNPNKKIYAPSKWAHGPDLPRYYTDNMIKIDIN